FYVFNMQSSFSIPKLNKHISGFEARIKEETALSSSWSVIVFNQESAPKLFKTILNIYLYMWTNISREFNDDLKAIEKAVFSPRSKVFEPGKMFPRQLELSRFQDFSRIGFILSAVFKETVWGWEVKSKPGRFFSGKDYISLSLFKAPAGVKKYFNRGCYKIAKRAVYIS
ncbi:MAG: hypothetical protein JW867_05535, partial [Candidatus Omnitrophica bacterium]|nr:hypothetical protein [Candidatus Omnitrophota bacterium]